MLSSYTINILILYLFNKFSIDLLNHPLSILRAFLYNYSELLQTISINSIINDSIITINGIESLKNIKFININKNNNIINNNNKFNIIITKYQLILLQNIQNKQNIINNSINSLNNTNNSMNLMNFPMKYLNIQDPVNPYNNLGYSLTKNNISLLLLALIQANRHIESLFPWHPYLINETQIQTQNQDYNHL